MGFIAVLLVPVIDILGIAIDLYFKLVVIDVILYWLLEYKMVSVNNKYAEKFMSILEKITKPAYELIKKKVRPIANIDISPYVLLLGLIFVSSFISHLSQWLGQFI